MTILQYCNAVKTTLKVEYLSEQHPTEVHHYLLDLGKSLYKLYFQLLLLIEAGNKIIATLHNTLRTADVVTTLNNAFTLLIEIFLVKRCDC